MVQSNVIVILQLARAAKLSNSIILSNSLNATKVMFNPPLLEVDQFKERVRLSGLVLSQGLSQTTFGVGNSSRGEIILHENKKTLLQIRNSTDACRCSTVATIQKIQSNFNWFYDACSSCKRSVKGFGDELFCAHCNKLPSSTIPSDWSWEQNPYKVVFISDNEVELIEYVKGIHPSQDSSFEVGSSCFEDSQKLLLTGEENDNALAPY